ncbi:hypothetical protein [Streptomyces sp. Rer75]|uniref:hypothetical protein n=1 Tax=Streptomyces sp. Rer75 TaxID=2750011 RepID=UPI0015D02EE8|nr:hypothetical protein [Streptomyces sp. Rer75]QLH21294.1 hypothetical protein HYQ63_12195 [Streptomyces sp. Rer75]
MHIPAYAYATIRAALPTVPTSRHTDGLDCCLCDEPFADRLPVPLGPTETSGLFGCRPCLKRLVARARRSRDAALAQDAERAQAESAAWARTLERHLAGLGSVRQAAEAVTRLAEDGALEPLRIAWLLVSLESAHAWVTEDAPEPPASADPDDTSLRDDEFRLTLEMISARAAVANRLAYHLINESMPAEPELCEEFECPEGCSGRHDSSHIDCGPDTIFEDLAQHGIVIEHEDPVPSYGQKSMTHGAAQETTVPDMAEQLVTVLEYFGIDADDPELLVSAAAVGLVADAWRDGPLEEIHAADGGPSDGEMFAQSVDLYRRARAAFIASREDGSEALLAFQTVASDVDLPWAGGSRFTLSTSGEPTDEFVQHLDDRVWYTSKVMREQGWRAGVLHRAASAAAKASAHFGMPGWPAAVASAMERLAALDRSDAPEALADLTAVEAALHEAPDQLGADALDWLCARGALGCS